MVEAVHLTKRYGKKAALDDVSFRINTGETVGLLGPNGAGKSTLMSIIAGCVQPTAGTVRVDGLEIGQDALAAKRRVSFLPELPPLYPDMTVKEQLRFACALRQLPYRGEALDDYITGLCERTGAAQVKERLIRNLSKGYRQRIAVAQMLAGAPELLLLDEPTVGLDPRQIREFRELLIDLGKRHTVLISSHILTEIASVCRRVLVFDEGRLIADGEAKTLQERLTGRKSLALAVAGERAQAEAVLREVPGVLSFTWLPGEEDDGARFRVDTPADADVRKDLFSAFAERRMPILLMKPEEFSLEELYLKLTEAAEAGKELPA